MLETTPAQNFFFGGSLFDSINPFNDFSNLWDTDYAASVGDDINAPRSSSEESPSDDEEEEDVAADLGAGFFLVGGEVVWGGIGQPGSPMVLTLRCR